MVNQKSANQRRRNQPGQAAQSESGFVGNSSMRIKQRTSDLASTMTSQVQGIMDQQVVKGARMVSNVAHSARRAADELENNAPQVAGLVREMAQRIENYSRNLEHQSVSDIYEAASDFTRRQPALVFGVATLAGFFMLRTLKSSQADSAPAPIGKRGGRSPREKFHGA